MTTTATTGWLCECGRTNVSDGCPRCGKKRGSEPRTPTRALPRNDGWRPNAEPGRETKRLAPPAPAIGPVDAAVLVGLRAPRQTSMWEDFTFAISKPLGTTGLLMCGFGALLLGSALLLAASPFGLVFGLVALVTYFWLYGNYFLKTITVASLGHDELPDSPSGLEAYGFFSILWMWLLTYLGLALPALLVTALSRVSPVVAQHMPIAIVTALLWPTLAYPMTVLLLATTKNPTAAFFFPTIVVSMVRTVKSYVVVLGFVALVAIAPQFFLGMLSAALGDGALGSVAVFCGQSAIAMYSMMATGLFLGRFYYREKATLGWFAA